MLECRLEMALAWLPLPRAGEGWGEGSFDVHGQGQLAALRPLTRLRRPLPQGEAKRLEV